MEESQNYLVITISSTIPLIAYSFTISSQKTRDLCATVLLIKSYSCYLFVIILKQALKQLLTNLTSLN